MAQRKRRRTTPEQARHHLSNHATFLRQHLKMLKVHRAPRDDTMEYVAEAIERFLAEPSMSLGQAFGVEKTQGNPGGPGKHSDLAYHATLLRANGMSWKQICNHLKLPYDINEVALRKICDREKEAVFERIENQIFPLPKSSPKKEGKTSKHSELDPRLEV